MIWSLNVSIEAYRGLAGLLILLFIHCWCSILCHCMGASGTGGGEKEVQGTSPSFSLTAQCLSTTAIPVLGALRLLPYDTPHNVSWPWTLSPTHTLAYRASQMPKGACSTIQRDGAVSMPVLLMEGLWEGLYLLDTIPPGALARVGRLHTNPSVFQWLNGYIMVNG